MVRSPPEMAIVAACVLAAVLGGIARHRAEDDFGVLMGAVEREDGAPAPGIGLVVGNTDLPMLDWFYESQTDEMGRFRIRHPKGPEWRIRVYCEFAKIEGLDGLDEYDPNRDIFRVPDPSRPVRIRVTSFENMSHVRCIDARTGRVLSGMMRTEFARAHGAPFEAFTETFVDSGGWDGFLEKYLPYPVRLPVPPEETEVRISMPGYAPATRRHRDLRGWVTVPLEPSAADVTGTVILPEEFAEERIKAAVVRADTGVPLGGVDFRGLPSAAGRFQLHGVPPGTWDLVLDLDVKGRALRATRRFEKGASPLDLGEVRVEVGARATVRVLDADGRDVPGAPVVLTESDASAPPRSLSIPAKPWDEERIVEFADLRPGVRYRVSAEVPEPAPAVEFVAPAKAGESRNVELRCGARLVTCRIRLLFEGSADELPWGESGRSPGAGALTWCCPDREDRSAFLLGEVLPGTYRLEVQEHEDRLEAGATPARLEGEITVPAEKAFEATLDLRRVPR